MNKQKLIMFSMMFYMTVAVIVDLIITEGYNEPLKGLILGQVLAIIVTPIFVVIMRKRMSKKNQKEEENNR